MKKILITIIAMLLPMMASAILYNNAIYIDGIYYILDSSTKSATVSFDQYEYYDDEPNDYYKGNVIIPSKVTYKGVTYTVTSIGAEAFNWCVNLTSITIPSSVTSIGGMAFNHCFGLTSVHINDLKAWCNIQFGNNPLSIAHHLYLNGAEIRDLVIPEEVTSIGSFAFSGFSGLTSITIPSSVTSIGERVFQGCSGLTSIMVDSSNNFYDSRNNCNAIIDKNNQLIVGCKNTIIPNSVTSIGSFAFWGCSSLTSITIPNSVTSIGEYTFYGCSALTSATIGNGVTSIGNDAFQDCSSLTSITIPNSVTSIGDGAFSGCSGLTSITIPTSVTSIGNYAFEKCIGLISIIPLNNTPPTCTQDYFGSCNQFNSIEKANCVVLVPRGSAQAYKEADGWKDFQNIRELAFGDVNIDFAVDRVDLNATTSHIMGEDPTGFYESLADLNGDDQVNAADVVKLVTILNIQDGLSMDWQTSYSNQVVSSLTCTLNNDGDKTIQLTKCELYYNQSLVSSSNFKTTLAPGGSKSRTFNNLSKLSAKTGFSVVWHYTYNGEDYTYRCDLTE